MTRAIWKEESVKILKNIEKDIKNIIESSDYNIEIIY